MSETKYGVAILGCGTVGAGVFKLLCNRGEDISTKYGVRFEVRRILVRDLNRDRSKLFSDGNSPPKDIFTTSFESIVHDPTVDVIVEVMGGEEPARDYLLEALRLGKHVVTANKALMGGYGERLVEKARSSARFFGYAASVTGFYPLCPTIVDSLAISDIVGVFNGTSNFILTKLGETSFDEALHEAQSLGYAEADHTNDTGGFDTRNKLIVAIRLAFGISVDREDIPVSGIVSITERDVAFAKDLGFAIKLLGVSRIIAEDKFTAFVAPCLVPLADPLAAVDGVENGIVLHDLFKGPLAMRAAGAGEAPTASAILRDLIALGTGSKILWADKSKSRESLRFTRIQPDAEFYVRIDAPNQPGVLAKISKIFAKHEVNIVEVVQKPLPDNSAISSVVILTGPSRPRTIQRIVEVLLESKSANVPPVVLRMEHSPSASRKDSVDDSDLSLHQREIDRLTEPVAA